MLKQKIQRSIQDLPGMREVEDVILSRLLSEAPLLQEIPRYLLSLGGKRFRPFLTLLVARAFGLPDLSDKIINIAAGIELIHMSTLLHDDIIDRSPMRRHKASPYLKYGVNSTLLAGDFLLVRAFGLCARQDEFIIASAEQTCVELTEGEILETNLVADNHDIASSIEIAEKKTASLFKLAALAATHLSGNDSGTVGLMAEFGLNLGVAFQILDDILDVSSDEKALGKPIGTDLREQKPSLVNILWLQSGSSKALKLREAGAGNDPEFIAGALAEIHSTNIVATAKNIALEFTSKARASLQTAQQSASTAVDTTAFATLNDLIDYTVKRVS